MELGCGWRRTPVFVRGVDQAYYRVHGKHEKGHNALADLKSGTVF
jgi:hypothetical protein